MTFLFLFALVAIVAVVAGVMAEMKRRDAFMEVARRLGMTYTRKDWDIPRRFKFLNALNQGSNRYAAHILEGDYQGHRVMCFDYHYQTESSGTKGRRQTHHHWFSFFILFQEKQFPELRIYPETFLSKIGQALGYDDIDFESAEFSRAFTVRSPDKRFAYDIIHTRMMEYLLRHPGISLEIEGPCVAMAEDHCMKPGEVEGPLRQLIEIRSLFPEYLYRD